MNERKNYKSEYNILLLFVFLFGALMTLLYFPLIKDFLPDGKLALAKMIFFLFVVSLLQMASFTGLLTIPISVLAMGSMAAIVSNILRLKIQSGDAVFPESAVLLFLIPMHFAVCSWGMNSSVLIRNAVKEHRASDMRKLVILYTIVPLGLLLVCCLIQAL